MSIFTVDNVKLLLMAQLNATCSSEVGKLVFMYTDEILNVTLTILSPNEILRILCFFFDVINASSNPRPLVIFWLIQNPKLFSKSRRPFINPLLSGLYLLISTCFIDQSLIPSSISSITLEYLA